MSYPGQRRFRIDLGVTHVPQPCERHKTDGFDSDCDACAGNPAHELKVPHLAGHFVEVKNPSLMPYGEKKRLFAPVTPLPDNPTQADWQAHLEALQTRRERIIAGLITAWDLAPVDDEGGSETLPLPKDDPSALDRAPDIVNQLFAELVYAQRRDAKADPETGRPSTEPSTELSPAPEENPDG